MANKLGSLVVSLGLEAAEFTRGMSKSEYEAQRATQRIQAQFGSLAKYVAGLGLGAAFVQSIRSTADYADELGKLAQKAGDTTTEVSKLAYAARQADVDNEQLAKALRALGEDALSGGEKLAELGINVRNASGQAKSNSDLFREVADAIASMEDPQRKAAAAAELLGEKVGPQLVPLLNQGSAGLKEMADEAERFGRVVTDDAAKAAEQFNDNITKLSEAGQGLAAVIGNAVIPAVNDLIAEFNTGIGVAGGFWQALTLGTINPFRTQGENIKVLRSELEGLRGDRDRYIKSNAETSAIDAAIKTVETKLRYLTTLETQAQAARVQYGADDQSTAEARRLGIIPPARVPRPAPARVTRPTRSPRAATVKPARDFAGETADEMIDEITRQFDELYSVAERRQQELADAAARVFEATRTPIEMLAAETAKLDKLLAAGLINWDTYSRAVLDAQERLDGFGTKTEDALKKNNVLAQDLGLTMSSAFEKAVISGGKLSDVLRGLAQDIAQVVLRRTVTEPLGGLLTTAIGSIIPSYDGGGWTGSGARAGGLDGKGGFLAMMHPREMVSDTTRGGIGGTSIVQTFNIGSGADGSTVAQLRAVAGQIKAETLAAVRAQANRGGSFASAVGRA